MSSTIVLIRHGITDWNCRGIRQGQANIPLNAQGRKQASQLAQELQDFDFTLCFSSPLSRALETAKIVLGNRDIPVIEDNLLVEQAYGLDEGTRPFVPFTHIPLPKEYNYQHRPERYQAPLGGESFEDLYARARLFLNSTLLPFTRKEEGTILIASHSAFLSAFENVLFDIPADQFWQLRLDTCGHAILKEENGNFSIIYQPQYKGNICQ
jgi:Fructose-2,6-bisphosphatase